MLRKQKSYYAATALCVAATLAVCCAVTANRTDVAQARASARGATIILDGVEHHITTSQATVGAVLSEAGIKLGPTDRVSPKPNVRVYAGIVVRVSRVLDQVVVKQEPIAFAVQKQPTKELRVGMTKIVSEGERGLKNVYYRIRTEGGVEKKCEVIRAEIVTKPKDKVILFGDRGAGISRGAFTARRVIKMHASAYDPGPRSCGKYADGRTSTGLKAGYGVVAVDPRFIKLGTQLYIEGYGYAVAGDRGRAIKGDRIDLGFDTYSAAKKFGRKHVTVHILQ